MHFYFLALPLCLAAVHATPVKRQGRTDTNDVTCSQPSENGEERFGPPTAIFNGRASSCGCASDVITGSGFGSQYVECNAIYPIYGTEAYNDTGLRQNSCSLDSNSVAACSTTCTPNTVRQEDGTCLANDASASDSSAPTSTQASSTSSPAASSIESTEDTSSAPASSNTNSASAEESNASTQPVVNANDNDTSEASRLVGSSLLLVSMLAVVLM